MGLQMSDKKDPTTKTKKSIIKPRKKFVPKKKVFTSEKPLEFRVRHIRLNSLEAANLIRKTILDYQKELADKPVDDPDKELLDQEKVERFFSKFAKKYSACPTRNLGGDLDWVHNHEKGSLGNTNSQLETNIKSALDGSILSEDLLDAIMKCERHKISEPIKTAFGYHVILICESRFYTSSSETKPDTRTIVDDIHGNAAQDSGPKEWSSDVAPN